MNGNTDFGFIYSFRGAYCSIYEKEPCLEIFDTKMDVMADTLTEMADKIIESTP